MPKVIHSSTNKDNSANTRKLSNNMCSSIEKGSIAKENQTQQLDISSKSPILIKNYALDNFTNNHGNNIPLNPFRS